MGRSIELGFTEERVPPGTHICYIFNDDAERRECISRFVQSGLKNGENVGYFVASLTPEKFLESLSTLGLDMHGVKDLLDVRPAEQVYMPDQTFQPDRMLATLTPYHKHGIERGCPGTRISGEMEWALKGFPGSDRLIEYEARINDNIVESPSTIICQYDARIFSGETIFGVLSVHPMMIIRGQVVRNPYYLTPAEYFRRHRRKEG